HRINSGDGGDFVLCHKLCEGIGRHRHIDYCRDSEVCKNIGKNEGSYEHIN
ncbi:3018_t:CDS:2, partial [Diversispora eburnea]